MHDAEKDDKYASSIEAFIATNLAPEALSKQGRIFIILLWVIMISFASLGASQVSSNFTLEFFLIDEQPVTKFM